VQYDQGENELMQVARPCVVASFLFAAFLSNVIMMAAMQWML
jgi:hypothetical protein